MTADTSASRAADAGANAAFRAPYAPPDEAIAAGLLAAGSRAAACRAAHRRLATRLIEAIRAHAGGLGGIEDFLHAYSLSTKEGLALMVLAEALLRVPDAATADRLIEDKLAAGDWSHHEREVERAAGLGLGLDARHHGAHHPAGRDAGEHPREPGQAARPAGGARRDAAGDAAARLAFRARPDHRGGARRAPRTHREFRYSFDMLGEGARTAADAERYFDAYARRDRRDRRDAPATRALPDRPGISVKLSALHPRYEAISRERVLAELVPQRARARAQGASATISTSPSMPKRPTGSSCRSR